MNIDLLPLNGIALESARRWAHAAGEGQTLTLRLGFAVASRPGDEGMDGTVGILPGDAAPLQVLRAAVLPAGGTALTLTF